MTLSWTPSDNESVNTEVTGTFTFKDNDVRAVYVDWDDGASNKKTEANYQWIEMTEPKSSVTATHTYNKSGTFNPIVQTVNSKGFVSRYYGADTAANVTGSLVPYTQDDTNVPPFTSSDSAATGIMRVENTIVKSGIDNTVFEKEGPLLIYMQVAPTLTSAELVYAGAIIIEVKALVAQSSVGGTTLTDGKMDTGYDLVVMTGEATSEADATNTGLLGIDFGDATAVQRVLSVKYKNPKLTGSDATDYTKNAALNNLKVFVVAVSRDDSRIYPISYVSPGSPYKTVEDVKRYITMDFSQSRAAASNVSNNYYFYDNGKGWFGPHYERWGNVNGALSSGKFTTGSRQTSSNKRVYYTYNPRSDGVGGYAAFTGSTGEYTWPFGSGSTDTTAAWYVSGTTATAERTNQFAVDDFGRFFDRYHLVRNSVEPSSSAANTSSISGNATSIFRITPIINFDSPDKATKFTGMGVGTSGCLTADYSTPAFNNNATNASGMVSVSGMNRAEFKNWQGSERAANEYLLALWDAKTNKIFFQCTPWWSGSYARAAGDISTTTGLNIAGVSYLRVVDSGTIKQTCEWVPLEFTDTTASTLEYKDDTGDTYTSYSNSFTKSGYISFDMPLDWSSIKMEELYAGNSLGVANTDADVPTDFTTAKITVGVRDLTTQYAQYGYGVNLTGAAGVISGAMDDCGTADDVGSFKYMVEVVEDDSNSVDLQNMWVAAPNGANSYTNGWDGDSLLTVQFGDEYGSHYVEPSATDEWDIIVKRINFYEVFPGASKLWNNGVYQVPVDAGGAAAFPNDYGFSTYLSGIGSALKTAWSGNSKYPLLLNIEGGSATTDPVPYNPEIWNVLDATEGFTSLVKEEDDSAYSLNALPITADISIGRKSNFYQAITRKGKVFITQTGIGIEEIGFSSVALGDETTATVGDTALGSLYDYLYKVRRLQSEVVRVYWDEKQKDGTWVRFWGFIKNVNETRGTGGPRAVLNYTFTLSVEEIALIDNNGHLMTDIFPLGGIQSEPDYS